MAWFKNFLKSVTAPKWNWRLDKDLNASLDMALEEVNPKKFVIEEDAIPEAQMHLVSLSRSLQRPDNQRFHPISFEYLVDTVKDLKKAGILEATLALRELVATPLIIAGMRYHELYGGISASSIPPNDNISNKASRLLGIINTGADTTVVN